MANRSAGSGNGGWCEEGGSAKITCHHCSQRPLRDEIARLKESLAASEAANAGMREALNAVLSDWDCGYEPRGLDDDTAALARACLSAPAAKLASEWTERVRLLEAVADGVDKALKNHIQSQFSGCWACDSLRVDLDKLRAHDAATKEKKL